MATQKRISASSYSNTAPLIWSFLYGSERGKYEVILDTAPSRSAELLAQKRVDAALVPVIAYQRIKNVRLIPDVCVGAREKVRSVCLVTKGEDLKDVRSVSLDVSSKTSVALTKIIFREFLGFEPKWIDAKPDLDKMLENSDCALLIGDPALQILDSKFQISNAENQKSKLRKFDLVELWREFTDFGFVFAMWMTRNKTCEIDFAKVRDEGLSQLDEIIANYENEISLTHEDFKKYLTENISFSIDDSMQKGLELYFELAHKNNLIDDFKKLNFSNFSF
ncbi:MAG: menaquinone biosynthesis protein [Acidobacteriota bacterium]|jgi:chorismate dehydratase|nr:menaquinone biosynthesis protein [Acidobacteriota bacterium]